MTAYSELFSLVAKCAAKGALHVNWHAQSMILGIPDVLGQGTDYYGICPAGHVSPGHLSYDDAKQWTCAACEEDSLGRKRLEDLRATLTHLKGVDDGRTTRLGASDSRGGRADDRLPAGS